MESPSFPRAPVTSDYAAMAWRLNLSPVQRVREEALDLDDAASGFAAWSIDAKTSRDCFPTSAKDTQEMGREVQVAIICQANH